MSPTSYQLLYPAIFCSVVPVTGLEPVQYRYRGILSPLCLPIPPHRQLSATIRIPQSRRCVKHGREKPSKNIFVPLAKKFGVLPEAVQFCGPPRIYWLGDDLQRRKYAMEQNVYQGIGGGDVDDLIFQDSWTASQR